MRQKAIILGVVLACMFGVTATASADFDHFIDLKKQRLLTNECKNEFQGCLNT